MLLSYAGSVSAGFNPIDFRMLLSYAGSVSAGFNAMISSMVQFQLGSILLASECCFLMLI
jgi:hypothetical protein